MPRRWSLLWVLAGLWPASAYAILGALPAVAPSEAPASRSISSLPWPGRTPVKLRTSTYVGHWDGMPIGFLRLVGGTIDHQVRHEVAESWNVESDTPLSFAARHRWHSAAHLSLAIFPRPSFLPSLDEPDWSRYRASYQRPGYMVTPLFDDDSSTNLQMLRVLGHRTRLWAVSLPPEQRGAVKHELWQIFVDLPDALLVLSLRGPEPAVRGALEAFASFAVDLQPFNPGY